MVECLSNGGWHNPTQCGGNQRKIHLANSELATTSSSRRFALPLRIFSYE
jgi:hypothetical protein